LTEKIARLRAQMHDLAAREEEVRGVVTPAAQHAVMPAPDIATLRAIYCRRMTLFDRQRLRADAIAFRPAGDGALRMLTAFLRR
jgi:hypothetical protein